MIAVADTHALLFAATGKHRKIGRSARRYFQAAESRKGNVAIYIPAVSLVEIMQAHQRGRISIGVPLESWMNSLFAQGPYLPADLTAGTVVAAQQFGAIPDIFDRLIAATALVLGCPLLTRDPEIVAGVRGMVNIVWD